MAAKRIPLFPLGLVMLPGMLLPLHIFEERYKQMISDCLAENTPFGIVWFDGQTIHPVGCTARVVQVLHRYEDGRMDILTRGEKRFYTEGMAEEKPYMEADVLFIEDADSAPDAEACNRARTLLVKLQKRSTSPTSRTPGGFRLPSRRSKASPTPNVSVFLK
jgi:Lon protease-like protein